VIEPRDYGVVVEVVGAVVVGSVVVVTAMALPTFNNT